MLSRANGIQNTLIKLVGKQNLSAHGAFGILVDVSLFSYKTAGVGGYNVEHTLRFLKVFADMTYTTD